MAEFRHRFVVNAPLGDVLAFHQDTRALKRLTPPPIFAQIHHYEPLAEGSRASFTLWFGPFPVRWQAIHSDVGPNGFTDTQVSGPLRAWRHSHRFTPLGPERTLVEDHIVYDHHAGWRSLASRLLFARPGLYLLFTGRKWLTRRGVARLQRMTPAEKAERPQ